MRPQPISAPKTARSALVLIVSVLALVASACSQGSLLPDESSAMAFDLQGLAMAATETANEPVTVTLPTTTTMPSPIEGPTLGAAATPASTTTTTTTIPPLVPPTYESVANIRTIRNFTGLVSRGPSRWTRSVPGIQQLSIVSTADGTEQPTFWLPPSGTGTDLCS